MGRTTKTTAADGSYTSYLYNEPGPAPSSSSSDIGQTVRVIDPVGRWRWSRANALGQLVEVVEPAPYGDGSVLGAGNLKTSYQYNALGLLLISTQGSALQQRRFAFDSLGRLTKQYLPEKSATLDDNGVYVTTGKWSDIFTYDDSSNSISHIDARGIKTAFNYGKDPLDRLQSITYDESGCGHDDQSCGKTEPPVIPTSPVTYSYMPTGDVTRLYQVKSQLDQDNTIVQQYGYDSQGRLSSKTLCYMKMPPLVLSFDYDTLDRIKQETYPAEYGFEGGNPRQKIDYEYQAGGVLKQLQVDQVDYASEMKYGPGGQLTSVRVGASAGNPSTETYSYDPANGLPSEQSVHQKGKKILNLGYKYFPGGQLKQLLDLDPSKALNSRAYSYDALARLRSVSGPLPNVDAWTESYTFDGYGNRTTVELSPPTAPIPLDGFPSHSYDQNTNRVSGFTYDAAGNVTRAQRMESTGKTSYWVRYRYDDAGRLALVTQDGDKPKLIEAYAYGSDRHRLVRRDFQALESTLYVWDGDLVAAEYKPNLDPDSLLWLKSTIYLGNRVLATFQPRKVSYHHPDRLGTRLITNSIDSSSIEQLTLPFGTLIGESADPVNPIFTTYDRSSATGLDYAVNRQYDSQDRFTQVDPSEMLAVSSGHPQSLNLYAYAADDPVNKTDPIGLKDMVTCTDNGDGTMDCGDYGTVSSDVGNSINAEASAGEQEITVVGNPSTLSPSPAAMSNSFQDFMMTMMYGGVPGGGVYGSVASGIYSGQSNNVTCHSLAAGDVPSGTLSSWASSAEMDRSMVVNWAAGTGPTTSDFGPNSVQSQQMMGAYGLAGNIRSFLAGGDASGHQDFGTSGLISSGLNPTGQFVGSYDWNMSLSNGNLNITMTNTTTAWSAFYHAPVFSPNPPTRTGWSPMGKVNQTFHIQVPCP